MEHACLPIKPDDRPLLEAVLHALVTVSMELLGWKPHSGQAVYSDSSKMVRLIPVSTLVKPAKGIITYCM